MTSDVIGFDDVFDTAGCLSEEMVERHFSGGRELLANRADIIKAVFLRDANLNKTLTLSIIRMIRDSFVMVAQYAIVIKYC